MWRDVKTAHGHHGFDPGHSILRRIGVNGRQRAVVARVHRLQHIERFIRPDFSQDDSIRTHSQAVADQGALRHFAFAFYVCHSGLKPHHMILAKLELGRVLNRDDPFRGGDEAGEQIQHRGFAGPGSSRDHHTQARLYDPGQQLTDAGGQRAHPDQILQGQHVLVELADGESRTVDGERRHNGVDPRSIGKPRIDHRRGFVDAPSDCRHDLFDDLTQMRVVAKPLLRSFQFPTSLDVDLTVAIHQNVRHRGIFQ